MGWLADVVTGFSRIVGGAVSGGFVVAMALVCLLQYFWQLYQLSRARAAQRRHRQEMANLKHELDGVERERTLSKLENHLLREFVAQSELGPAVELLLRSFVPEPEMHFGVLVCVDKSRQEVTRSRGLSEESLRSFRLDKALIDQIQSGQVHVLEGEELAQCPLYTSLADADRAKARQLFLVPLHDERDLVGVLAATSLYPHSAPLEHRIELAGRLTASIAGNLRRFQTLAEKETQLRTTHEMLELRSTTDRGYDTPGEMVSAFLGGLQRMLHADSATLFISPNGDESGDGCSAGWKPMVRCDAAVPTPVQSQWRRHEETLAEVAVPTVPLQAFDPAALRKLGVDTLIDSALLVPLPLRERQVGLFCLMRRSPEPFDDTQCELAIWAARHLGETLVRIQAHADIALQARQDALTLLANRRTFDDAINREFDSATRAGTPFSLLMCDLDHFKSINDTWGHLAGDEVLRATARLFRQQSLRSRSGEGMLVARYGGEELAVLLRGIDGTGALRVAEEIRQAVRRETIWYGQMPIQVTVSIGMATWPDDADTVEELVAAADAALYHAKESGRDRVSSCPPANRDALHDICTEHSLSDS